MSLKKPRVALFTPLPPAMTGTADYGASLAAEMEKLVSLTVYEKPPLAFDPERFDHIVYQIGNNPYHAGIYELALQHPGVVVLHEASVHYLIKSLTLSRGKLPEYVREVTYEMFGEDVGNFTSKHLPIEVPQPHEFLMLRRLLDKSKACIVHSHYAERLVRLKGFRGPIGVVPHGVALRDIDPQTYRQKLNLDAATPLIGVFGYQRPDKQIWDSLLMYKQLVDALPDARLLILGQPHPQVPLEEGIKHLGLGDRVLVKGHQTLDDFDGYLSACNVVLNLRQTTFGETSGTMMRAFTFARPVIVSGVGGALELPDGVCIKIPRDRHEVQVTIGCLKWLLSNPSEATDIGVQAKQWVEAECTWTSVAQSYVAFLQRAKAQKAGEGEAASQPPALSEGAIRSYVSRWIDAGSSAGTYFAAHATRLIRTLQLIPRGGPDSRILELGCYMQITPALRGLLGYSEVRGGYAGSAGGWHFSTVKANDGEEFTCAIDLFNCEVDRFPYPDEYFDTIICCELLEHLEKDPMHMMSEIHRVLKQHGTLVLTTPNAVSIRAIRNMLIGIHPHLFTKYVMPVLLPETRHAREYTPKELLRLFADSGFSIQYVDTANYGERPGVYKWITKAMRSIRPFTRLREDCVYLVGQKTNPVATRYPSWLYEQ
ncbi:MAG TPA: methyltransferase domain-containing protein [Bryobacteraceae bacterium]|jgi:glycosyltransferase involved in cell wall biosynthesis/predicted SAM-dependent methyltransferase